MLLTCSPVSYISICQSAPSSIAVSYYKNFLLLSTIWLHKSNCQFGGFPRNLSPLSPPMSISIPDIDNDSSMSYSTRPRHTSALCATAFPQILNYLVTCIWIVLFELNGPVIISIIDSLNFISWLWGIATNMAIAGYICHQPSRQGGGNRPLLSHPNIYTHFTFLSNG